MIRFASVTPNLVVKDVARSTAFYRDVLGFKITMNVPDAEPFVFVGLERDGVPVFLNDVKAAAEDYPSIWAGEAGGDKPSGLSVFGGTATMFFVVTGIDELHAAVAPKAKVVMALKTQFYGMREFAITDPDGHLITFAERVAGNNQ